MRKLWMFQPWVVLLSVAVSGCSKGGPGAQVPMVADLVMLKAERPGAVLTEVTLKKAQILGREFLYGADLQYSSMGDVEYSLISQVTTLGHFDARFRVIEAGGEARLQLVADQRVFFESDINHPERLIHEFKVLKQTAQTITIQIERGSPVLSTMLSGGDAPAPRSSWVRSVQYDAKGNYLMFETSIEDAQGNVAEFMESLFPRETLVPADAKPLLADPTREPFAERFRLLGNGSVFLDLENEGRVQTSVATRFGWNPQSPLAQPIAWYVTSNIPDEYLPEIRMGVEAWNRYSQSMWGKDIVTFAGKLPAGVRIGDPRYNVIGWDSVAEAGAAYETQSADPRTGIQSHSLVYLPYAWINIGKTYWEQGDLSDKVLNASAKVRDRKILPGSVMGRRVPLNCVQDSIAKLSLIARQDPESFARELLKGVLFHELGHALGLAHNFKGSLSWNPEDSSTLFSTSIMDYNQYQIERAAFDSLDSANGPLLEYDRQILSVLYNGGADLKQTDPVLPACADDEADSFAGGADPLCIRYDAGSDPTEQLMRTIRLVTDSKAVVGPTQSLPVSISLLTTELGDAATAKDLLAVQASTTQFIQKLAGIVNFYYIMGAQSVAAMARDATRPLRVIRGELPKGLNEPAMRARALEAVEWVLSQDAFATETDAALHLALEGYAQWLLKTPVFAGVGDKTDPRRAVLDALVDAVRTFKAQLTSRADRSVLTTLRRAVLVSLDREEGAPFYLNVGDQGVLDVEARVLQWLERSSTTQPGAGAAPSQPRSQFERMAAVRSLRTFAGSEAGDAAIGRAKAAIQRELSGVRSAQEREKLRKLVALLTLPQG